MFCQLYYSTFYELSENDRFGNHLAAFVIQRNSQNGLFLIVSSPIIATTNSHLSSPTRDYFVQVMSNEGKLLWITWDTAFTNKWPVRPKVI